MSGSHIDIVRDLIARFFNGHNPDLATEFFAPDLDWNGNGGSVGSVHGAENYAAVMLQFFEALPDVHAAEQEVLGDGDKVAVRFIVEGTHTGNLWGVPATGNHVKWNAIMTYRFVDGKVAEQWPPKIGSQFFMASIFFTPTVACTRPS